MSHWFMLTLVGKDQQGIVAQVTTALYEGKCNLGEASMLRLGGNFTMMLMVNCTLSIEALEQLLQPVITKLQLHLHLTPIEGQLHHHIEPEVRISVHGADRAGIVAQVTSVLAEAGLNILDLESDVGGSAKEPFYIMHIEGIATLGIKVLEDALQQLLTTQQPDLKVQLEPIEILVM